MAINFCEPTWHTYITIRPTEVHIISYPSTNLFSINKTFPPPTFRAPLNESNPYLTQQLPKMSSPSYPPTSSGSNKRLLNELKTLHSSPLPSFLSSLGPVSDAQILVWEAIMLGPVGGPYHGKYIPLSFFFFFSGNSKKIWCVCLINCARCAGGWGGIIFRRPMETRYIYTGYIPAPPTYHQI